MRVLHTADFHAGRNTRGFDRTPELHDALTEIVGLARTERADAVLVAGDLFDTVNPGADAEGIVYDFFLRLRDLGIPSVVLAGNHDSASRLNSLSGLLGWVGVQMVAELSANPSRLVRTVQAKNGETLVVAAIPYLSERRMLRAADLFGQEVGAWRQRYRDGMGFLMGQLGQHYQAGAVNMMMMHATLDGAQPSGQRSVTLDIHNSYTVSGLQFPAGTQYAALGHVHKPQVVGESRIAHYPGSLIQLDFGEGGEQKQVNLVEVEPGRPAHVTAIPLASGRTLRTLRVTHADLEARLTAARSLDGLLKVVVSAPAGTALPGLKDQVLRMLPNVLAVELDADALPEALSPLASREHLSRLQLFEQYYRERRGQLPDALRTAFLEAQQAVQAGEVEA
ncbi:exonuclease SbcCD subunit D [Deinococcus sonorensis]|uniref:Nuclease SbcCD subunit D n=1 Tax=Deinococcus sonorensis KR-87 TaxID=694439 RepID=A0AAU7UB74_9DEIO